MQVMSNAVLPASQSCCNTVSLAARQNSDAKLQDVQITNLCHLGSCQAPYISNDLGQLSKPPRDKWSQYLLRVSDIAGKSCVCSPKSVRNSKFPIYQLKCLHSYVKFLKITESPAPLKFLCVCTCVITTFPSNHCYPDHAEITVGYLEPFRFQGTHSPHVIYLLLAVMAREESKDGIQHAVLENCKLLLFQFWEAFKMTVHRAPEPNGKSQISNMPKKMLLHSVYLQTQHMQLVNASSAAEQTDEQQVPSFHTQSWLCAGSRLVQPLLPFSCRNFAGNCIINPE